MPFGEEEDNHEENVSISSSQLVTKKEQQELKELESKSNLDQDSEFALKVQDINKRLRLSPRDRSLWLEFIDLQDSLLKLGSGKGKKESYRMAINEKKLIIYERALQKLPEDGDLLNRYMECCEETLE